EIERAPAEHLLLAGGARRTGGGAHRAGCTGAQNPRRNQTRDAELHETSRPLMVEVLRPPIGSPPHSQQRSASPPRRAASASRRALAGAARSARKNSWPFQSRRNRAPALPARRSDGKPCSADRRTASRRRRRRPACPSAVRTI